MTRVVDVVRYRRHRPTLYRIWNMSATRIRPTELSNSPLPNPPPLRDQITQYTVNNVSFS